MFVSKQDMLLVTTWRKLLQFENNMRHEKETASELLVFEPIVYSNTRQFVVHHRHLSSKINKPEKQLIKIKRKKTN